jgi:hypothetical protein
VTYLEMAEVAVAVVIAYTVTHYVVSFRRSSTGGIVYGPFEIHWEGEGMRMIGLLCDASPMIGSTATIALAQVFGMGASKLREYLTEDFRLYGLKNEDSNRSGFKELILSTDQITDFPMCDYPGEAFTLARMRYEPRRRVFAQGSHYMLPVNGWYCHLMVPKNLQDPSKNLGRDFSVLSAKLMEVLKVVPKISGVAETVVKEGHNKARLEAKDAELARKDDKIAEKDGQLNVANTIVSAPTSLFGPNETLAPPKHGKVDSYLWPIVFAIIGFGASMIFFPTGYDVLNSLQLGALVGVAAFAGMLVLKKKMGGLT